MWRDVRMSCCKVGPQRASRFPAKSTTSICQMKSYEVYICHYISKPCLYCRRSWQWSSVARCPNSHWRYRLEDALWDFNICWGEPCFDPPLRKPQGCSVPIWIFEPWWVRPRRGFWRCGLGGTWWVHICCPASSKNAGDLDIYLI